MRRGVLLRIAAVLRPPLSDLPDSAGQDLAVDRRGRSVQAALVHERGQVVRHLLGDVGYHRGERFAPDGGGGLVGEEVEAVGILLDVVQEADDDSLQDLPRSEFGTHAGGEDSRELRHLTVDDHLVEAFFTAEMLVHDRFGHVGGTRDFLDGDGVVPAGAEKLTCDSDELLAPLGTGHADATALGRWIFGHDAIIAVENV